MRCTQDVVDDLSAGARLIRFDEPVDPYLELAEIQRRVYASGGPAVLFTNVTGCDFPVLSNMFASLEQARYLFRHTLRRVEQLVQLKIDPSQAIRFWRYTPALRAATWMLPRRVRRGPVMANRIALDRLPAVTCWPEDGGPFITLPQVLSQAARSDRLQDTNLGMYRVQLSGNQYDRSNEVGLHYQIHRGIGVHHRAAIADGKPFRVVITVGGSPAMTLAAVMPLPEGLSELTFAGALAGHRIAMITSSDHGPLYADADFAIVGTVDPERQKPEGPFGDHLGYYSLQHDFPLVNVQHVYHRDGAIWPMTVVGRPPQEDTTFGQLIHEITGPAITTVLPGVQSVHAVDAAGVHPLLLAIGSERYMPMLSSDRPQELLTQANAILGNGQLSLAKYLWIANQFDNPQLDIHDVQSFLMHMIKRVDWRRDLHFQTCTTIDTLDYSGSGFNQGSKVVIAARGAARRALATELPSGLRLPPQWSVPKIAMPGVMVVQGPAGSDAAHLAKELSAVLGHGAMGEASGNWRDSSHANSELGASNPANGEIAIIVVVDDAEFASRNINNFVWTTFTRSDPARDIAGVDSFVQDKHWGCHGPLVIDARCKSHHAHALIEDPNVSARVDALAARGGTLARYL